MENGKWIAYRRYGSAARQGRRVTIGLMAGLFFTLFLAAPELPAAQEPGAESATNLYVAKTAIKQPWDSHAEAWINFNRELERLQQKGTFDANSIRVFELRDDGALIDAPVPARWIPNPGFHEKTNPSGRVVWQVKGDGVFYPAAAVDPEGYVIDKNTKERKHRFKTSYRVCFDLKERGPHAPLVFTNVPSAGNIFPNGGFELVTKPGIPDLLCYFRPEIMALDSQVTHAGKYALRIAMPPNYNTYSCSISVPDLRVEGGKNYVFSFWGRAQGTDSVVAYHANVLWCGLERNYLLDENKQHIRDDLMKHFRSTDFNWERFQITLPAPTGAYFASPNLFTWSKVGAIWADDLSVAPQVLPDDPLEAERIKIETTTYPELALMQEIRPDVVTPHVPWLKPSAGGPIKTLYLAHVRKEPDGIMRTPIELLQRMDLDLTFVPVLKRRLRGKSMHSPEFTDDLEPYSVELLRDKLKTRYELIILDSLDFKGVQPEFAEMLTGAATNGTGVLFLRCANLPGVISNAMQTVVPAPEDFKTLPELNTTLRVATALPNIVRLARTGQGKMAVISDDNRLYPCVPVGESIWNADPCSKSFHGWEYQYILWLKTMRWLAGRASPAVTVTAWTTNALVFSVQGAVTQPCQLEVNIRNSFGRLVDRQLYKNVFSGTNIFAAPLARLPGGTYVAEYRLLDKQAKVNDGGAYAWKAPAACSITNLATDKRYYRKGEPVTVRMALDQMPDQTELQVKVWDTYDRLIGFQALPLTAGQTNAALTISLPAALSIIHYAEASLVREGVTLAEQMVEFSRPDAYPGDDEYGAYLWSGSQLYIPGYFPAWKNAGFDSVLLEPHRADYLGPKITRANLRPWGFEPIGKLAHTKGDQIRDPCFSDPAWWRARETNAAAVGNTMAYYGIRDCILCDELNIGPVVCFSENCLQRFRGWLRKQYPDLKALNTEWGAAFAAWDEVKPLTLKETQVQKKSMVSWLDHKMFMTLVFAEMIDRAAGLYRPMIPEIKTGLSGTQEPGFSYNWWEFMKYAACIANYGGIQNDLIRSFRRPGMRVGRWTGGYAPSWINAEKYERNEPWQGLFNGNNCYFFFQGCCWGMYGDFRMNANTIMALEEVQAIKNGVDKLLLNADHHFDGIVIHYSHASLFAAKALNMDYAWSQALYAWKCLMDDMGLSYRFVAPEQIENGKLDEKEIKVLILPVSLCLSRKEVAAVTKFVKRGGLVIADYGPGVFNQHGNPDAAAGNCLFGVERGEPGTNGVRMAAVKMHIGDSKTMGLRERALPVRYVDEDLKLTTGHACADAEGKPALIVNETGKGRTILLDCAMHEYAKSDLAGVGGEEQLIGRGDPALTMPLLDMVGDLMAGAGITPTVTLKTRQGVNFQPLVQTHVYRAGPLCYVGILKSAEETKPILPEEHVPVSIDFGSKSHVYDVRAGRYLGYERQVETDIAPAIAKLYALLPYRVQSVTVKAGDASRGDLINVKLAVKGDRFRIGRHAVVLRFIAPDKKEILHYRTKAVLENGKGAVTLPMALNDPPGEWTLKAKDVASGVTGSAVLTLK